MGQVYDVGTSLANYLLAVHAAEPVTEERTPPAGAMEHHELLDTPQRRLTSTQSEDRADASDMKRRPTKRR